MKTVSSRLFNLLICLLLSFTIISCKSSSSSDDDTKTNSVTAKTGVFIDDVVQGISYKSGATEGVTNQDGEFKYEEGKEIVFSLGDVEIGRATPEDGNEEKAVITPLELIPDASADKDTRVNNIVRFLLTLDDDPSTPGITIKPEVAKALKGETVNFGQGSDAFAASVTPKLKTATHKPGLILKTEVEAKKHFNQSLEKRGIVPRPKISDRKIKHDGDFNVILQLPGDADASIDIYYTLDDGQEPNVTDAKQKYSGAVEIKGEGEHTLKVLAYNPKNKAKSKIVTVEYLIKYPEVAVPVFKTPEGTYTVKTNQKIEISCPTAGAKVYYTTNGKDPVMGEDGTSEFPAAGYKFFDKSTTIKAVAIKNGVKSEVVTKSYKLKQLDLRFNLDEDSYPAKKTLRIYSDSKGTIHYTTVGTNPTADSAEYPSAGIEIAATTTVKAISIKDGWENSNPASITITIDPSVKIRLDKPELNPSDKTADRTFSVSLRNRSYYNGKAEVYYTIDGSNPDIINNAANTKKYKLTGSSYYANISINKPTTLKIIAVASDKDTYRDSVMVTGTYKFRLGTPSISPSSYSGSKDIKASEKISFRKSYNDPVDTKFYYSTISEADLTIDDAHLYKEPFSLKKSATIYFRSAKEGYEASAIKTQEYKLVLSKPEASVKAGNYTTDQSIELTSPDAEVEIYYTTDGTEPTAASTLYTTPIQLTETGDYTIKAIAIKGDLKSSVTTTKYSLDKRPAAFEAIDNGGFRKGDTELSVGTNPKLIENDGVLYATWIEGKALHIAKYNKTDATWNFVSGDNGVNRDSSKSAATPSIAVYKDQVYLSWIEDDKVRVSKYTGSTWETIDGASKHLNRNASNQAFESQLYTFKEGLFLCWGEKEQYSDMKSKIFVSRYDGISWAKVDTDAAKGLSGSGDSAVSRPQMTEFNNELYVLWKQAEVSVSTDWAGEDEENEENPALYMQKYVETGKWKNATGTAMTISNQSVSKLTGTNDAEYPAFAKLDNSKLYLTWQGKVGYKGGNILVSEFNGTDFNRVDGDKGIQENSGTFTVVPKLAAYGGQIYATWQEESTAEVLIKKYDGSSWKTLDGVQRQGETPQLVQGASNFYLIWNDGKIRVEKFKK